MTPQYFDGCHPIVKVSGGEPVFAPQVAYLSAPACADDKSDSRFDPCTRPATCDDAGWRPVPQSRVIPALSRRTQSHMPCSPVSPCPVHHAIANGDVGQGTEGTKSYRPTLLETKLGVLTNRIFPEPPNLPPFARCGDRERRF